MKGSLTQVIGVDEEKCVNCHMCISVCPVKYCIDGSGDYVDINHDMCIGCGECIDACTHEARYPVDDKDKFFEAVRQGKKVVAIAAPAVASSFPDEYLKLNGYLKSIGVEAIFDVSFGAELTVLSYLDYIKKENPKMVIAQPCPAIVTYIETYQPELIPYLAPAHSPMLHTIMMVREFYPQYKSHYVAILSPCLAKRREFDETRMGDFNVTLTSIKNYIKENKINLTKYPEEGYENPPAERAVGFSSPGGLMQTAARENPDITWTARKIEGPRQMYGYLKKLPAVLKKEMNPLLIDCLNCEMGCNGGPGTGNRELSPDENEYYIKSRIEQAKKAYKGKIAPFNGSNSIVKKTIGKYWKTGLYARTYQDRSSNVAYKIPNNSELEEIYAALMKYSEEDFYNCSACGYNSCEKMAIAIYNGLNKPENCHFYKEQIIQKEQELTAEYSNSLHDEIQNSKDLINDISATVNQVNSQFKEQMQALEESSAAIEEMVSSLGSLVTSSEGSRESIDTLVDSAKGGSRDMDATVQAIENIDHSLHIIEDLIGTIDDVADNTNLLSMNAAIEAAHAGQYGKGFAVVAQEIRKLADETGKHARSIGSSLKSIEKDVSSTTDKSRNTGQVINQVIEKIVKVADEMNSLITDLRELNTGNSRVKEALNNMHSANSSMTSAYSEIQNKIENLEEKLNSVIQLSDENVAKINSVSRKNLTETQKT